MESEYIYTHETVERVWDKEESSFILGYSSSQVACKSSPPVPAPAVFQNIIEIRLESAARECGRTVMPRLFTASTEALTAPPFQLCVLRWIPRE